MRYAVSAALVFSFATAGTATLAGAEISTGKSVVYSGPIERDASFYWKTAPVANNAQLLTLFCRSCGNMLPGNTASIPQADANASDSDIPLVSILRDTLGDSDVQNDRLLYVWLLTYVHPSAVQYMLSAMPFLYWRVGDGYNGDISRTVPPLLNLTTPERPLVAGIGRQILQSSLLDPSATPIRATSRAYRGNESDYQRLRLEEAVSYLRKAPVAEGDGPSQAEIDTVVARLELRKRLLGGLVTGKNVEHVGAETEYAQERIRSRNWEVLRQCAERTGLIFEPFALAGGSARYGILWFPKASVPPSAGVSLKSIWRLLSIRNPWTDRHLRNWRGPVYSRAFDQNGTLLPAGSSGASNARLIPLGVYSLDYPTTPLLLVDFRNGHIRRHEMTQRAINDVTAGVIGISHFSNWYFYVAADLYDFVESRHGTATNQSARLDCYSQFRAALVLDRELDPTLRAQIQARMGSLALNPLEASPSNALQLARARYQTLLADAQDGKLSDRIDNEHRAELAEFGESSLDRFVRIALHDATLGAYTHRVKKDDANLATLDRERRVRYQLNFLDALAEAGTAPEVSYASDRIQDSISSLSELMPQVRSSAVRAHATRTLEQLQGASQDSELQANCATALSLLNESTGDQVVVAERKRKRPMTGVVTLLSTAHPESGR